MSVERSGVDVDTNSTANRFTSPFDVPTPLGAEGWQEMYPYYALFGEERRSFDEGKFWFFNSMHTPEPMFPFDLIAVEAAYISSGQFGARVFNVPTFLGLDWRVLNGYVYMSVNLLSDQDEVMRRLEIFKQRAGHYYQNWDDLAEKWQSKVDETIQALTGLAVPDLPRIEDERVVFEAHGVGSGYRLLTSYEECIGTYYKIWQFHFEMLLLGYAAYMTFFQFCGQAFPDITDSTVSMMVSGFDVTMFRPDDELKELARIAIRLGVDEIFSANGEAVETMRKLAEFDQGKLWLEEFEQRKDPWFHTSTGDGFYHHHRSWADDLTFPFSAIRGYIERLRDGEDISRPVDRLVEERERISFEYANLLDSDEDRQAFAEMLGLARKVFPHVESHKFYVEHWASTLFFNKIRDFGALLHRHDFLRDPEDVFLLHFHEVRQALSDLVLTWAGGSVSRGPGYWPPIVERRRGILATLADWRPPPVVGPVPEEIADPMLEMLWGVTTATLRQWTRQRPGNGDDERRLHGYAASPGTAEGRARVVLAMNDIGSVRQGEILVCRITAPSWGPVFPRIRAAVTDIGGMMSHAAIVAREYGLPMVVGTGRGTEVISTGQLIRVDGSTGLVTILPEAP